MWIEQGLKIMHLTLPVVIFKKATSPNEYSCTVIQFLHMALAAFCHGKSGRAAKARKEKKEVREIIIFSYSLSLLSNQPFDFW